MFRYNGIYSLGALAHVIQSLQRDKGNIVSKEYVQNLLKTYNLKVTDLTNIQKSNEGIQIFEAQEDGSLKIEIDKFSDVQSLIYSSWEQIQMSPIFDDKEMDLVNLFRESFYPVKSTELYKKHSKDDIQILTDLNLIIDREGFIFNPDYFKGIKTTTLDLITEYDLGSENFINDMEKIQSEQGYPLEHLNPAIQDMLRDSTKIGMLVPIEISVGPDKKTHVFCNPKAHENSDLVYQTAAFFKYNQLFANIEQGRILSVKRFLNALINRGTAGRATNIGINYEPLELKGVIKVYKGSTSDLYRMSVLKKNVLEEAYHILTSESDYIFDFTRPSKQLYDPASYRSSLSKDMNKGVENIRKLLRGRS
jgi:hypothetical protein